MRALVLPKNLHRTPNLARELATGLDASRLLLAAGVSPYAWQRSLLLSSSPRVLLLCARQTGKSTVTAAIALHHALFTPNALVLLLSPALRQSQELFRKVVNLLSALPFSVELDHETSLFLEFANRSRIVCLPASEATIRGYSGVTLLIIDEAARVPQELYFPFARCWRSPEGT